VLGKCTPHGEWRIAGALVAHVPWRAAPGSCRPRDHRHNFSGKIQEIRIPAFFVKIFGYAAQPIAGRLEKKGGELVIPPEGFYVDDTEGPLLEGELERAADWARQIVATQ